MKSNLNCSPETLNLGQNQQFFVPCDFEIWRMTLKNNRTLLLCYIKLCASFESHGYIQTGVIVRKRLTWVKIDDVLVVWPWNLTDDLGKQQCTFSKEHQALCVISSPYVNSNCSHGPEIAMLGFDLSDLDLWPLTLSFCIDVTFFNGNTSWSRIVSQLSAVCVMPELSW